MIKKYKITLYINKKKRSYKFNDIKEFYSKFKEYYLFIYNNNNRFYYSTSDNNVIYDNLIKNLKMFCDLIGWSNRKEYFTLYQTIIRDNSRIFGIKVNKDDILYIKLSTYWYKSTELHLELISNINKYIYNEITRMIEREMNFVSLINNVDEVKANQLKYLINELDKLTNDQYDYKKYIK